MTDATTPTAGQSADEVDTNATPEPATPAAEPTPTGEQIIAPP